ncbi:MAG: hypothetical protein RJA41_366 [Actinomycetota bacterium]
MLSDLGYQCVPYSQAMVETALIVSQKDAKRVILAAQGLLTAPAKGSFLKGAVDQLGAVQLDTISVLARSHELVAHARHSGLTRSEIEDTYWNGDSHFEYWSHAACILPIDRWPMFSFRRKAYAAKEMWNGVNRKSINQLKKRLANEGGLTTTELGGGRKSSDWWDWSETKSTVEWMLVTGEVTCTQRIGWRRVYSLSENAIPSKYFYDLPDDEAIYQLLLDATRSQGVATMNDILDVHRLKKPKQNLSLKKTDAISRAWQRFVENPEILSFTVPGWNGTYYGFKNALENQTRKYASNSVLLSPFDSLVWHRPRLEEVFGMEYRIEAYTPKGQRYYGYFAMPVLVGDEIVARVDPKRNGKVLTINRIVFESNKPSEHQINGVAKAILRAANWVNCEAVEITEVIPKSLHRKISQLVS